MASERSFEWMEGLARSLLHHAARRAPDDLSERLREEWLADMSERPQGVSRLRFALGCHWATSIIAREHSGASVPAVSAAVAPANVGIYLQMGPAYSPRRTATFILVASLHAAVLGGLMLGLTAYKKLAPPDFQTVIIDKLRPPIEGPTIDRPNIAGPRIDASPPPVIHVTEELSPTEPKLNDDSTGSGATELLPQDPPPHVINRIHGAPGVGFPNTSDYYPDSEIRRERQGNVAVNVCVDVKGRLTSTPSLLQSSGSAPLDQAGLRLAKAGSGHYRPSTEDGRAVESCYGFLVQFILK